LEAVVLIDAERLVLSKAIQTGKIERLVGKGVDSDYFYSKECQEVWDTCVNHLRKYKSTPSLDAVRKVHPDFTFELTSDSFDYVYDTFVKQAKRRTAIEGLRELAKLVDDPDRIEKIDEDILLLGGQIARMFPEGSAARFSEMDRRISLYEERKDSNITVGIPFGLQAIDELTQGIQGHEYISVVGWQGTGKSTLALHICFSAYLAGFTPLIVSLEMEAEAMFRKFDVMATNMQSLALKKMELEPHDIKKWQTWAERARSASNDIIVIDNVSSATVERIHSIAEQYSPDLLVVDYVSLMDTPKGYSAMWEKVTYLTQRLKAIARDPSMPPVIGIAQTNASSVDEGAKLETIAYSRSIGQDSDIVLGLYQDKEGKMKARHEMEVRMLKNRDGETVTTKMYWNPAVGEFREWRLSDMFTTDEGSDSD
jgi:replicative DNA helicase